MLGTERRGGCRPRPPPRHDRPGAAPQRRGGPRARSPSRRIDLHRRPRRPAHRRLLRRHPRHGRHRPPGDRPAARPELGGRPDLPGLSRRAAAPGPGPEPHPGNIRHRAVPGRLPRLRRPPDAAAGGGPLQVAGRAARLARPDGPSHAGRAVAGRRRHPEDHRQSDRET